MVTNNSLINKKATTELVVRYVVTAVLIVFLVFPFLFMICKSLFTIEDVLSDKLVFFPSRLNFSNYSIFKDYLPYLGNTMQIVLINAIFIPFSACFCAYPLARRKFVGKKLMFAVIMSTVMIPGIVLTIPTFILYSQMGLYDTIASQWIQSFFGGGALNIFLVIQFMRTIPKEMDEAAKIDGANAFMIFFKLVMPLCMNIFLFISINTFIGLWMDFQGPMIYLRSVEKRTLALKFYNDFSNLTYLFDKKHIMAAMAVCLTVPPILLFLFFQNRMIGGIKLGGVKG